MTVYYRDNIIFVIGELSAEGATRLISGMHEITNRSGYQDFEIDFSDCTNAFSTEMLAICARCQDYWKSGIDIKLSLPKIDRLRRLFQNANWAHLIDVQSHSESRFRGYTQAKTMRFSNENEQFEITSAIVDILLAALKDLKRDELRVLEWSINEITDNVINHANSRIGGLVQVNNYRQSRQVEFVVSDAGIGIPASLRSTRPNLTDIEAIDSAIREGVTRDPAFGQGNGLFGTWQIAQKSGGTFKLVSGKAELISSERLGLKIKERTVPYVGTLVSCRVGFRDAINLDEIFKFGERTHEPVDYIDTHFEIDGRGRPIFNLANESTGFGSRKAGEPVRRKIANLLRMSESECVIIDLSGVSLTSSSYADEVFGKLFKELGPINFNSKLRLQSVDPLVQNLIDRAIMQRMAMGDSLP